MSGHFLVADRPDARLFACVADARFVEPEVSASRLAASLRPFPDRQAAELALVAAGGRDVRELH